MKNKILPIKIDLPIKIYLPIKIDKYCCQICNYVAISAKNNCEHRLCDYCFNKNIPSSKIYECILCQMNKMNKMNKMKLKC